MSKADIFNYFYTNSANLDVNSILTVMGAGLVIGLLIYITYLITYRGVSYNAKFNLSLVVILEVSVVIMLMISSNIVISLGMVGALSIVRFRTAIKDTRDTIFIFWAIAEGLSVGSQNFQLAIITTLFIGIILIIASFIPNIFNRYMLIVTGDAESINQETLAAEMAKFVKSKKLRTANKTASRQEFIWEIRTRGEIDLKILDALMAVEGVETVNWVVESGETVG